MIKSIFKIVLSVVLGVWTLLRIFSDLDRPPVRWDEVTNVRVLRETVARKSFPVLYYAGKPFFQKPPLWYLLNLAFISDHKSDIIKIRMISIISALLVIALSVIFVWRHSGFFGGLTTWITLLLSNQLYTHNAGRIFSSHTLISADSDSFQILFILISFFLFLAKNKRAYLWGGITTSLAVLIKGPLGFVPLMALTLLRKEVKIAWLVSFIFILPWYIFMFFTFGQEFLQAHIGYHLLQRVASSLEGHNNPPWYYLQILTNINIYPAFPLVVLAVFFLKFIRDLPFVIIYCGLTALFLLIILSLVGTRLAWYILPIYPFLAMFSGMILGKVVFIRK